MTNVSVEELAERHKLLRADPWKYIELMNGIVERAPNDASEYLSRHFGWVRVGDFDRAMADLNKALELKPGPVAHECRGLLWAGRGQYRAALSDFARAEALDPEYWKGAWGPLYQAHCFAEIGNEEAALTACNKLPDSHWSPGLDGTPRGNKDEVTAEIRRRLAARKQQKLDPDS